MTQRDAEQPDRSRLGVPLAMVVAISSGAALQAGCMGEIDDAEHSSTIAPPPDKAPLCTGGAVDFGVTPFRRLTPLQYANTIHDLFGSTVSPGPTFPTRTVTKGFSTNADLATVS